MSLPLSDRVLIRTLAGLTLFGAISAAAGAWLAISAKGGGVPLEYLDHSPFDSFVIPGLVLGGVVGGTQGAAAIAVIARRRIALLLSTVAGFGMLIWIFVELAMLRQYSWLQTVYFVHGCVELLVVLALLGLMPSLAIPWPAAEGGAL
jgi:hypothetical protein